MKTRTEEICARREQLIKQARDIAEQGLDRDVTKEELRRYEWLNREINSLGQQLRDEQDLEAGAAGAAEKMGLAGNSAPLTSREAKYARPFGEGQGFTSLPGADAKVDLDEAGKYVTALITGEERSQNVAVGSEGGYMVPVQYAAPILDQAINLMRVREAGARVVPLQEMTAKMGRLGQDPAFAWRAEGGAFAESAAVFGEINITARSAAMYLKVSVELMADVRPSMEQMVSQAIARAAALEMDRVALLGTGTAPMPRGLANFAGVNSVTLGSGNGLTLTDTTAGHWQPFVAAKGRLATKNYRNLAVIYAPRTAATLGGLRDTANQPLQAPDYLSDVRFLDSGQVGITDTVGTSTDCSAAYMGDYSNLLLGIRSEMVIQVLREAFMVTEGRIGFAAYLRMDVQLARTAAFELIKGIRP